jgi:hypothetical protein
MNSKKYAMKVFIVESRYHDGDGSIIIGIYSTLERAVDCVSKRLEFDNLEYDDAKMQDYKVDGLRRILIEGMSEIYSIAEMIMDSK